jgi:hypothetical protein
MFAIIDLPQYAIAHLQPVCGEIRFRFLMLLLPHDLPSAGLPRRRK